MRPKGGKGAAARERAAQQFARDTARAALEHEPRASVAYLMLVRRIALELGRETL